MQSSTRANKTGALPFVAAALAIVLMSGPGAPHARSQAAPDTRIRAYTEPAGSAWLSQQVRLFVEVSTDSFFREAPDYPDLQIEGAIVLAPGAFGVNFTETVNGKTYAGQRRSYLIFPQRSGELRIPALDVGLTVAQGSGARALTLTSTELSLRAAMPPGAEELDEFVSTPRLDVRESLDRSLQALSVGDAFVRSVTITGDDTLALVLPTLSFSAPEGIAVYASLPQLSETTNRGRYTGTRIESATYVLERAGDYTLPPIEIKWWNTATESMQTGVLPAMTLAVAHASMPGAPGLEDADEAPASALTRVARRILDWLVVHAVGICIAAGGLYVGVLAWRRFAAPLAGNLQARRRRWLESERYHFSRFARACRHGGADEATRAFWSWYERAAAGDGAGENGFAEIWGELAAQRYGPAAGAEPFDTGVLLAAATAWRAKRRAAVDACRGERLNPGNG